MYGGQQECSKQGKGKMWTNRREIKRLRIQNLNKYFLSSKDLFRVYMKSFTL